MTSGAGSSNRTEEHVSAGIVSRYVGACVRAVPGMPNVMSARYKRSDGDLESL